MGMTCHVHAFAARVGGEFRISLAYDAPTGVGKTTAHTDTYHGRFVEFVPNKRVVEIDEFETEDPTLGGEMKITIELVDKRLKIWWPGTELNRRRQPFQGCSRPKLSIHSARDNPEFLPVFVLLIGAKMEPSKVTQICLPRFASNRHGFEFASTPSRILAASFDN